MKNTIIYGVLVGLLLPAVAFGLLYLLFLQLEGDQMPDSRVRTSALVALCLNAIPLNIFSRRRMHEAARGIVFPTTLFVVAWLVYFGRYLF